jgi:hypothetical protein
VFQYVDVGLKAARHQETKKHIATVYRKVPPAAKAQRLSLKFTTLNPILLSITRRMAADVLSGLQM